MKKKTNKTVSFPNNISKIAGAVLISAVLCMQTACNNSGGGGLLAGGGIGGTGISVGEISGFGSIIVNDVDFDTTKAQVFVSGRKVGEGNSGVRNNLALGMIVRVEGNFLGTETGQADRIVFNENVLGPVTAVETLDTGVKKITVLGQIVIVDEDTYLMGTDDIGDILTKGNVLQISGWTDGYGVIQATYVGLKPESTADFTAKGIVTQVNERQKTLRVNLLSVDFNQAELRGFPDSEPPAIGQLIVATGMLDANGILIAKDIGLKKDIEVEDAQDIEIEGIVSTQFSSPLEFTLGTTPVITDAETVFKGIAPDDIFSGLRLLVKGSLTGGQLLADEVIAKDKVNLEGTVESVDAVLAEISLRKLDPLVIHVNDATKIFGDAAEFTDLRPGQHVKIIGYVAGQDKVEAAKVKVEKKASDKVKLQGPVTDINIVGKIIYILSIELIMDEIPDDGFKAAGEGRVSRNDFFNLVDIGDTLSANGNLIGDAVEWKGIELLQE